MQQLKSAEEMPGSYGLPILGETLEIFRDLDLFVWRRFQQHDCLVALKINTALLLTVLFID